MRTFMPTTALALLLLAGCASAPTAPSIMALPGSSKSFEQFRYDDSICRDYARGLASNSSDSGVRSAAIGTAVGAVAGAATGGHEGAAVGAGTGLIIGSEAGADANERSGYGSQHQYDNAYVQCMYAKGEKVPASGAVTQQSRPAAAATISSPLPPSPPGWR